MLRLASLIHPDHSACFQPVPTGVACSAQTHSTLTIKWTPYDRMKFPNARVELQVTKQVLLLLLPPPRAPFSSLLHFQVIDEDEVSVRALLDV